MKRTIVLLAVCAMLFAGNAFAGTQDFTVVNNTGVTINALYSSPTGDNKWGEDILGVDVLENGQSVKITFSGYDACTWDLRVEDAQGNPLEWDKLDLCSISKVTLNWDGSQATATLE